MTNGNSPPRTTTGAPEEKGCATPSGSGSRPAVHEIVVRRIRCVLYVVVADVDLSSWP
jgi:hypothetical protein